MDRDEARHYFDARLRNLWRPVPSDLFAAVCEHLAAEICVVYAATTDEFERHADNAQTVSEQALAASEELLLAGELSHERAFEFSLRSSAYASLASALRLRAQEAG